MSSWFTYLHKSIVFFVKDLSHDIFQLDFAVEIQRYASSVSLIIIGRTLKPSSMLSGSFPTLNEPQPSILMSKPALRRFRVITNSIEDVKPVSVLSLPISSFLAAGSYQRKLLERRHFSQPLFIIFQLVASLSDQG